MKDLKFPSVRTVLWDRSNQGPPINIHVSSFRKPRLCLLPKALRILQEHGSSLLENQLLHLSGDVLYDKDSQRVSILVDCKDDSNRSLESDVKSIQVSILISNSKKCGFLPEDYNRAVKNIFVRCRSKDPIQLGDFFSVLGKYLIQTDNGTPGSSIEFDVVTASSQIKAVPINPVPIMPTALSKNLASPMSLSNLQGKAKSGYLTMDHTRKLVLMLESDPKVSTLPLIGIWVSGLDYVCNPYVWACCLRYLSNNSLQQRVCLPPHHFMLVLYCPQQNKPEFYECGLGNGDGKLHQMEIYSGNKPIKLDYDQDVLEIELSLLKYGVKKDRIDGAAARLGDGSKNKQGSQSTNDEMIPRTIPTPHQSKIPEARFSVPEVSLIFNDSYQPSNQGRGYTISPTVTVPKRTSLVAASNCPPPAFIQSLPVSAVRDSYPGMKNGTAVYSAPPAPTQFCQQNTRAPLMYPGIATSQNLRMAVNTYANQPALQTLPDCNFIPVSEYSRPQYPTPVNFQNRDALRVPRAESHSSIQYHSPSNPLPSPEMYGAQHQRPVLGNPPNYSPYTQNMYGPFPPQPAHYNTAATSKPVPLTNMKLPSHFRPPVMCEGYPVVHPHSMPPHSIPPTQTQNVPVKHAGSPGCPCCVNHVQQTSNTNTAVSYPHTSVPNFVAPNQGPKVHGSEGHIQNMNCIVASIPQNDKYYHHSTHPNRDQHLYGNNPYPTNSLSGSCDNNTPTTDGSNSLKDSAESSPIESIPSETMLEDTNCRASKDSGLSDSPDSAGDNDSQMSKIQWDNVPPEIYKLLMLQSAQLQELKSQIHEMKLAQDSQTSNQTPKNCATSPTVTTVGTNCSEPKTTLENSIKMNSVGVNTSFQYLPEETSEDVSSCTQAVSLQMSPIGFGSERRLDPNQPHFAAATTTTTTTTAPTERKVASPIGVPEYQQWSTHHDRDGSYAAAINDLSHGDFSAVARCLSINQRSVESFQSDMVVDLPSYQSSISRSIECQYNDGLQSMSSTKSLVSASMCAKTTNQIGYADEDSDEEPSGELSDTVADHKESYERLIHNVKELLQRENSQDITETLSVNATKSPAYIPGSFADSPGREYCEDLMSVNNSYLRSDFNPVDCTFLPKINYISMLLESDTETSMEINCMALKYLKDEQLTQMAKLQLQVPSTQMASKAGSKNLLRQIMHSNVDLSSPDISKYGMSVNDLTFATRKYMEKHHLIEESVTKKGSPVLKDPRGPPSQRYRRKNTESKYPYVPTPREKDLQQTTTSPIGIVPYTNNKSNGTRPSIPRTGAISANVRPNLQHRFQPLSESTPMGMPHPNHRSPPHQNMFLGRPSPVIESDNEDSCADDRILDIPKLKQMPKLL